MEFKDNLKKLRKSKQLSQQQLADSIYVSRSAIAKWENGLGLPNETSYHALLTFFETTAKDFPLVEETENISIIKNKKIYNLSSALICLSLFIIMIIGFAFAHAFSNGYGFTPDMAVGEIWKDNEIIETPEYHFYYNSFGGVEDIKVINTFCVAEKKFIGYQKIHNLENYQKTVFDNEGKIFGYIYSFKGEKCYYHFFKSIFKNNKNDIGVTINLLFEITIKADKIPVLYNSYFQTPFALKEFRINNISYIVK